jgi:hypothetical protein
MSRWLAALAALFVVATGPALAQGQPQAPAGDAGKLTLPQTAGGATLTRSAGTTSQYTASNGMEITVDAYGNRQRVPNGSSHPTIINEFNEQLNTISQQATMAGMKGFEKPAVPSACTYGQYTLRCVVFSVQGDSLTGRIYGKFMLIGYREHFVKIIVRWTQTGGQTNADADKVLAAFVPALLVR